LTPEEIEAIGKLLPPPSDCAIFDLEKIINGKKKLSTIEKIAHLDKLEEALLAKIHKTLNSNQGKNSVEQQHPIKSAQKAYKEELMHVELLKTSEVAEENDDELAENTAELEKASIN